MKYPYFNWILKANFDSRIWKIYIFNKFEFFLNRNWITYVNLYVISRYGILLKVCMHFHFLCFWNCPIKLWKLYGLLNFLHKFSDLSIVCAQKLSSSRPITAFQCFAKIIAAKTGICKNKNIDSRYFANFQAYFL